MGLSRAEAESLGLGHLYPTESDAEILAKLGIKPAGINPERSSASLTPRARSPRRMTKLEMFFADHLEIAKRAGLILDWAYEPRVFTLAGRCTYLPDFRVDNAGYTAYVETKGPYAREDSLVKLKVAAAMYQQYHWLLVRRHGPNNWEARLVTDRGFSTTPIHVPWIHGA